MTKTIRITPRQANFLEFCGISGEISANEAHSIVVKKGERYKDSQETSNLKASAAFTAVSMAKRLASEEGTLSFVVKGTKAKKKTTKKIVAPKPKLELVETMTVHDPVDPIPTIAPPPEGGYTVRRNGRRMRTCKDCGYPHKLLMEMTLPGKVEVLHGQSQIGDFCRVGIITRIPERGNNYKPGWAAAVIHGIDDMDEPEFASIVFGLKSRADAEEALYKVLNP